MDRAEWDAFRAAVAAYQETKNTPPLSVRQVHKSVQKDDREKLARRGYRTYEEQQIRKGEQERFGFVVRLSVDSIDDIWEHGPHGNWNPRENAATFLQIRVEPVEEYFLPLARSGSYMPDSGEYHISLCYTSDLHRFNLYDFTDGLVKGKQAYDRVRQRYDGKLAHLRGKIRTGSVKLEEGTMVFSTENRNNIGRKIRGKQQGLYNPQGYHIYNDPDVKALISAGIYVRDDMHMTL
jgi:hypothetical protein